MPTKKCILSVHKPADFKSSARDNKIAAYNPTDADDISAYSLTKKAKASVF